MRDWKTTASAAVSAGASFIVFANMTHMVTWPQWVLCLAQFAQAGGLLHLGISAKDYTKPEGK